jgi:hypothetical protein
MRKVSDVGNVGSSSTRQRVEPRQIKICTFRSTTKVDDDMESDVPNSQLNELRPLRTQILNPKSKRKTACSYYTFVDHPGACSGSSTLSTDFDGTGASES